VATRGTTGDGGDGGRERGGGEHGGGEHGGGDGGRGEKIRSDSDEWRVPRRRRVTVVGPGFGPPLSFARLMILRCRRSSPSNAIPTCVAMLSTQTLVQA
jgi:hypothetical protein